MPRFSKSGAFSLLFSDNHHRHLLQHSPAVYFQMLDSSQKSLNLPVLIFPAKQYSAERCQEGLGYNHARRA